MNAVVLAGGVGSRLRPLTLNCPKPMLPLAGVPMLDYTVSHLASFGVDEVVFTLGFMPEAVRGWVKGYELKTHCVTEPQPLGTCGGVKNCMHLLSDTFLVVSGDALENIDFSALIKRHRQTGALVTMACVPTKTPWLYGVADCDGEGFVTSFTEKPPKGVNAGSLVNCGVYAVQKEVFSLVPSGGYFDFARDLFPILLGMKKLACHVHDGFWCDIGDITSYFSANFTVKDRPFFPPANNCFRSGLESIVLGEAGRESVINLSAHVYGTAVNSIVGRGAVIRENCRLENCIVFDDADVSESCAYKILGQGFAVDSGLAPKSADRAGDSTMEAPLKA